MMCSVSSEGIDILKEVGRWTRVDKTVKADNSLKPWSRERVTLTTQPDHDILATLKHTHIASPFTTTTVWVPWLREMA